MKNKTFKSASELNNLPSEIAVLPAGEYMTVPYGNMVFDDVLFAQMIGNFERNTRVGVPVDVDHDGGRAAGWIKKLKRTSEGLFADVEWTPYGQELVQNKEYRMISAEWSFDYVENYTSRRYGAVLIAATITNRPLFQNLPVLTASEPEKLTNDSGIVILMGSETKVINTNQQEQTMQKDEILAKKPEELSVEEIAFLKEQELTDEQKEQFASVLVEKTEEVEEEATEEAETEEVEKTEEVAETPEVVTAIEETVTIKASELAELQAIKVAKEQAEIMKAAEDFSAPFLASEGGKIMPVAKDTVVAFVASLSEEQRAQFGKIMASIKTDFVADEKGDSDHGDVVTRVEKMISDKVAGGMNYGDASKEVLRDQTLADQYYEAVQSK